MRRWRRCHTAQLAQPWLAPGCSSRRPARRIRVHTASVSVHEPLNETLFARGRCRAMGIRAQRGAGCARALHAPAGPEGTNSCGSGHWTIERPGAILCFAVDEPAEGHCLPGWRDLPTRDAQSGSHRPLLVSAWWASSSPPNDAPRWTRSALRCPGAARAARAPTLSAVAPGLFHDHPGVADLVGPGGNGTACISGEG